MEQKTHKIMLAKVLLALYKNSRISPYLGFKGGTCALFFYGLPRMSVDLDFDYIGKEDNKIFIESLTQTLEQLGVIKDYKDKFYTIFFKLNYNYGSSNIKIEIRKGGARGKYITKNFMGENISIMKEEDLFSNKLLALLNRNGIANRDIFDVWFFLQKGVDINKLIIEKESDIKLEEYLQKVILFVENYDFNKILYGLGELIGNKQKIFAKTKMKAEILQYLKFHL